MHDISLFVEEAGTGRPMILLHGNSEDHTYFHNQMDFLAEHYHVFALDSRGHGQSPRGEKPLTLGQMAQDVFDFIEEHGWEKVTLLGFSDGANIAMLFAMAHPDRLEKLILNAGNLVPEGMPPRLLAAMQRHYHAAEEAKDSDPAALDKFEKFSLMVNEPQIALEDLAVITVPTLVVAGNQDMILQEHTEQIAEALPDAKLVILEGDHFVAKENPAAFNAAVGEFLGL